MRRPFLALITPLSDYDQPDPTTPPGIWGPTDPRPSNPIQLPPWVGGYQPGIWGPNDPRPSNPISGIPGLPGYQPPQPPLGFWGPNDPRPSNPIQLPPWAGGPQPIPGWGPGFPNNPIAGIPGLPGFMPPPDVTKPPEEGTKPPPPEGGWGYSPEYGWGYFPPDDVARPKKK